MEENYQRIEASSGFKRNKHEEWMSDWTEKELDGQNVGQTRNWAGNKLWD